MEDVLGFLCGAAITLTIIAAIGHGLWLAAAWFFRVLAGAPSTVTTSRRCEVCSAPLTVVDGRCQACGAPVEVSDAVRARADLFATRRQLNRWQAQGKLAPEQFAQLVRLCEEPPGAMDAACAPSEPEAALDENLASRLLTKLPRTPNDSTPSIPKPLSRRPAPTPVPQPAPAGEDILVAEIIDEQAPAPARDQSVHPLDQVESAPIAPPRPSVPRRAFADVLQAFMEQKNIRWVELISGLLIVGCATGLVVSLRAALRDKIPYFPALSFMLVTAAFHAAGIYSLRRWNLKSTSRGVLIIATLLVPLSILAAIFLSGEGEMRRATSDPVFLLAVCVGVVGFTTMNYFASRALIRHGWWRLMVAVLGASFCQILVERVNVPSGQLTSALPLLPALISYLVASVAMVLWLRRKPSIGQRPTQQLFLEVGIGAFAFLAPVGLFVARADTAAQAIRDASPLLSLAAAAVLAAGLVVHRRVSNRRLIGYRTAGTAIAILAGGLMLAFVVFAWPDLRLLIAVGFLNFISLLVLAVAGDLALLHGLAAGSLSLAYLGMFLVARGFRITAAPWLGKQLMRAVLTSSTALALSVFATAVGAVGIGLLVSKKQRQNGLAYLACAAAIGAVCIAISFYSGFWLGGPAGNFAAVVLAYFAVLALAAAWVTNRQEAGWAGTALLLGASIHGTYFNEWIAARLADANVVLAAPLVVGFLLHAIVASLAAAAAFRFTRTPSERDLAAESALDAGRERAPMMSFCRPLAWSALGSSLLAIPYIVPIWNGRYAEGACYFAIASVAWLIGSWLLQRFWIWNGMQFFTTATVISATTSVASTQDWWTGWYGDARHIQFQIAVLGASCLVWNTLRFWRSNITLDDGPFATPFRSPAKWTISFDQALLVFLVLAVNVVAVLACLPNASRELGIRFEGIGFFEPDNLLRFAGVGSWIALGAVLSAALVASAATRALSTVSLTVWLSAAAAALIACGAFDASSTASALRWSIAGFAAAWYVPACYFGGRHRAASNWVADLGPSSRPADIMRGHSLLIATLVVAGLTTAVLLQVANQHPIGLPAADTFFGRISSAVSYATPLGVLAVVFFAYAIREGRPIYAVCSSAVFQYFVTLACLLPPLSAGAPLDASVWAKTLQWNLVGLATFSVVWIAARRWIEGVVDGELSFRKIGLITIEWILMVLFGFVLASWCTLAILEDPVGRSRSLEVLGGWASYLGLIIGAAGSWWLLRPHRYFAAIPWTIAAFFIVPILAATLHARDTAGQWWGYHTLTVGWVILSALAVGWLCWDLRTFKLVEVPATSSPTHLGLISSVLGVVLASLVAITELGSAPSHQLEGLAAGLAVVIAGVLAVRMRMQRFSYASLFYAGVATLIFYEELPAGHPLNREMVIIPGFFFVLLATACVWLLWEVWFQRRGEPGLSRRGVGAAHRFTAWASIATGTFAIGVAMLASIIAPHPMELRPAELGTFICLLLSFLALHLGLFWDRRGHYATLGLYVWLLLCGMFVVMQLDVSLTARRVAMFSVLAAQVAITGWVWSWGSKLAVIGSRLGMSDPIESLRRTSRWLVTANLLLAFETLIACTWYVLIMHDRALRGASATLPLLLAGGIAGMAQQHRRTVLQVSALLTACWAAVLIGWSDITPDWSAATVIARTIRMLMATCGGAFVLGVIAVRVLRDGQSWKKSVRQAAGILVVSAGLVLIATLVLEAIHFEPGVGAPVTAAQVAAVSVVLVGLIATLISLAVLPGRDPLSLTERGRMIYVYAAQAIATLLFAHIYLAMPHIFGGFLRPYWPYIIVGIAFAGIGIGTLFDRLGWKVLAEPFQRSGSFLPLIPALGMWFIHSGSQYASVLFVIGLLYLVLSFAQRSIWARAAAAVAGNGALWAFLGGDENLTFADHPQFWLIPPALSVMIAAQLQKHRLNEMQLVSIRYAAMIVIYISSSVEMVKIGIGESLWPPIILIVLSLAGIVFGIAMRIRAYLYLGTAFLLVSLFSMVAHASRSIDHVWPWWAFGIALGVAILVLFGYFESRRAQMQALVERLREWER